MNFILLQCINMGICSSKQGFGPNGFHWIELEMFIDGNLKNYFLRHQSIVVMKSLKANKKNPALETRRAP